jgi:hypothetical protein
VGCHINKIDDDTAYEFTDNIHTVLATTTGTSLPTPAFTFPEFGLDGYTWTITVNTLTGGAAGNQAEGDWSTMPPRLTLTKRAPILLRLVAALKRIFPERKMRKMQHLSLLDYSKSN